MLLNTKKCNQHYQRQIKMIELYQMWAKLKCNNFYHKKKKLLKRKLDTWIYNLKSQQL